MKTSELTKILKQNKVILERHGSSHDMWYSPITGKHIPVPRHSGEVSTGTAKSILKDAGIE